MKGGVCCSGEQDLNQNNVWNEIEEQVAEEENSYYPASELFEINHRGGLNSIREGEGEAEGSLFSFDFYNYGTDHAVVYVPVGNNNSPNTSKISLDSSVDALLWTLNHALHDPSSTIVFLIHIFPETKFIPTPLGMIPIGQVNVEQKENHMAQERGKRRQFIQKFLDMCAGSKAKVDTILIESDMEAKAILDLIPICNIRKLILGTSKANLKKMKSKRGSGTADQILQNAPEICEVKIICQGKEVVELQMFEAPSPRATNGSRSKLIEEQIQNQDELQNESFGCGCFKAKVML